MPTARDAVTCGSSTAAGRTPDRALAIATYQRRPGERLAPLDIDRARVRKVASVGIDELLRYGDDIRPDATRRRWDLAHYAGQSVELGVYSTAGAQIVEHIGRGYAKRWTGRRTAPGAHPSPCRE